MYLRRIELQGFKTFASKTILEFTPEASGSRGVTAIVGPNGSGKSNIADAIRWVMGEQSMKLLRGKKSEDVIFSGSQKKSRSGFAEVTMTLQNDDKPDIDMSEIVITRRLYRDGKSEYEINMQSAKLSDVVLLLAQSGLGQRTYSVIGQGMVDAVLSASPAERKEFFDEAAGLKPLQLKRYQAISKLQSSRENMVQAEVLLGEIGPRLRTLERQVKRLEKKDEIIRELEVMERKYFGGMWYEIFGKMTEVKTRFDREEEQRKKLTTEADVLEKELGGMEKGSSPGAEFDDLQSRLSKIAEDRAIIREKTAKLRAELEIAKVKSSAPPPSMPMQKIVERLTSFDAELDALLELAKTDSLNLAKLRSALDHLQKSHRGLLDTLRQPSSSNQETPVADPKIQKELADLAEKMQGLESSAQTVQSEIDAWKKREEGARSHLFETQRRLNEKRAEARQKERLAGELAIESARWETRGEQYMNDLRMHRPDWEKDLNTLAQEIGRVQGVEALQSNISKLRAQLEWIGSIDPETLKEYDQTKERHVHLLGQVTDLQDAIRGLDTVIRELDQTIESRSETAFHVLNNAFQKAFKILFGGGEAKLVQVAPEPTIDDEGNAIPPDPKATPAGIDIQATPPGKRLKAIALLSGGERALTSIALISAIMATNPSPFIVLDEVDAALDESNSKKFADIIRGHAGNTQFILITHNRATMNQAHVLYGVTLGEDGTSRLLSVKIEDLVRA